MPYDRMTPEARKAAEKANSGTKFVKGGSSTGETVAAAETTQKLQSSADTGLGSKGKPFTPPKMEPNETSAAYRERVRKARAAHDSQEPPKAQAIRNMMGGK